MLSLPVINMQEVGVGDDPKDLAIAEEMKAFTKNKGDKVWS